MLRLFLLLGFVAASNGMLSRRLMGAKPPMPKIGCILEHCGAKGASCMLNKGCRDAMLCDAKCQSSKEVNACNLLCELTYGYNSTMYKDTLQCAVDYKCMPTYPADGTCLATDNQTISTLTNMSQVTGKWWILKGLNCGQPGWPAAFDYFPCQRDEFVFDDAQNRWVDHIAYCGGTNNNCTTPIVNTVANVSITSPGVMTHWYTDPPLKPQTEEWRVLSWPGEGDWMLYIYCGSTPLGPYAGGSVVSRTHRKITEIPPAIEAEFRTVAAKFKFSYDDMCVSDVSIPSCTD
eukprot:g4886.t1